MKAYDYSHIGKKDRNEDFVGFSDGCYIVCDGVGGSTKGELASKEVVRTVLDSFPNYRSGKICIQQMVEGANKKLNELVQEDPSLEGMATTLASVFFDQQEGVYVAHIGDSRVYIIRPSRSEFWHTWDHSLVGNLVKNKEISREAGRKHPLNHQIFKALKGNLQGETTSAEINNITDLREGDLIFVCSDGVMETYSDLELIEFLMREDMAPEVKLDQIKDNCIAHSNDNHSAILMQLEKGDVPLEKKENLDWIGVDKLKEESTIEEVEVTETKDTIRDKFFALFRKPGIN